MYALAIKGNDRIANDQFWDGLKTPCHSEQRFIEAEESRSLYYFFISTDMEKSARVRIMKSTG